MLNVSNPGGGKAATDASIIYTHSAPLHIVEIVMIEKLDCILSKRATRPVYI